ncbi:hypothetical protein [Streptomyces racemochromogenes]|uniref:hypothetical protein n=1 Tax=Streptomyces racemochromogenes TaxID=67353 RepID=UPI0031EDC163
MRNEFPDAAGAKLPIVLTAVDALTPSVAANVDRYARRLSSVDAAAGVDTFTGSYRDSHRIVPPRPAHHLFAGDGALLLDVRMPPSMQPPARNPVDQGARRTGLRAADDRGDRSPDR